MDLLLLLSALAIFLISALWAVRAIRVAEMFHNPLVIPMIFWAMGYPVRYALAFANPDIFSQSELSLSSVNTAEVMFLALLFAAAFIVMIGLGLRAILTIRARTLSSVNLESVRFTGRDQQLIHVTFLVYAVGFVYLSVAYGIFGLYEDFSQLKKNIVEVFLGEIANLKWFVVTLCLLAFFRSRRRIYLFEALFVIASLLFSAFSTTSKSVILSIVIFLLLLLGMLGRKPPYGLLIILLGFGVFFGVISYQMREFAFFEVRDGSSSLALLSQYGHIELSIDSIALLFESNIFILIDRLSYYGDALILMINGTSHHDSDLYVFGSLVEIGNLIPSMVWVDRPHLSFNHHVSGAVWGMPSILSETPIGRIGEAFYAGHWFGFLVGFAYAYIFSILCLLWHKVRFNLWGLSTWSGLVMAWVVPDAYLTYGLKQVLVIGCVGYALNFLTKPPLTKSVSTLR